MFGVLYQSAQEVIMPLNLIAAAKDSWACFLLNHNSKTRIYRLVSGSFDVPLRRKRDSPMEEDDCAPACALIRVKRFPPQFYSCKYVESMCSSMFIAQTCIDVAYLNYFFTNPDFMDHKQTICQSDIAYFKNYSKGEVFKPLK